ncbi:uncharacterized protein HKW66_Vig0233580 [Vigna angularis]|uniref:Uncharacterized protein n=1 Tax=Phaseolus angularis TaxID=3914 RepID=A0A8T0KSQ5_PHAAN|nr:uncharacterized protein HKW66_Vig0233580 [Vigna angularis]
MGSLDCVADGFIQDKDYRISGHNATFRDYRRAPTLKGLVAIDVRATDDGSKAIRLGLRTRMDVGLKSVKEKGGNFEEGEGERGLVPKF